MITFTKQSISKSHKIAPMNKKRHTSPTPEKEVSEVCYFYTSCKDGNFILCYYTLNVIDSAHITTASGAKDKTSKSQRS